MTSPGFDSYEAAASEIEGLAEILRDDSPEESGYTRDQLQLVLSVLFQVVDDLRDPESRIFDV